MAKHDNFREKLIHGLFFFNGLLVVIVLVGIFILLIVKSAPVFKVVPLKDFLFKATWNPTATFVAPSYGMGSMLVSTLMVSIGALIIAIPLGIGTAAYLSDIASPRVREI
ncbi:MAG: phosphate ABC transporter permease subunit PstC, partial [Candidatus Omnitrophota bacterium]